ncbi:protease modulator HflC [Rickettsiales endosymbiont of Peranema trichophorum]|uniref:protease modulator HflC n=1 Tax=Rickettsiales endosymbiont of Peranema trichophorum TaxID=2486577 RepID=UPI001A9128B9|nr:protease modulator HflC [Rickettsiales endosymbiont of Peranema trichophorum]
MLRLYIILIPFVLLLVNSVYVVDQRQIALVVQFGEPVNQEVTPGLKVKLPFVQQVFFFDKRIENLRSDTSEVIASDQKTMRVDAFGKYKIVDALKFYQTVQNEDKFKARLAPILDSSLRQVLGSMPFKSLLTPERAIIMRKIRDLVNKESESFGVEVVDVRIMRADLPEKSREAVYRRMKTEREKEAKEIRAQGAEEAQIINAKADKDKVVILADAQKEAQILKGQGDAEAIKVFSEAFSRDPEFYEFYRTLEAYKKTIDRNNTTLVISPNNEFMKYLSPRSSAIKE